MFGQGTSSSPQLVGPLFDDLYKSLLAKPAPRKCIEAAPTPEAGPVAPPTFVQRACGLAPRSAPGRTLAQPLRPPTEAINSCWGFARAEARDHGGGKRTQGRRGRVSPQFHSFRRRGVFAQRHRLRAVHRIDGPIHLIRGFDREKDELCFELNKRFAAATVLQSTWTYQRITEMSYQPVKPVIIRNAVDASVSPAWARAVRSCEKIRLIATSWSNNARKGGPIYKWLEERLDWNRFDFTFVGNASVPFTRIRTIPAVPSEKLAKILREHDIYITASQSDPLFERCDRSTGLRLPVLYRNDGGIPSWWATAAFLLLTKRRFFRSSIGSRLSTTCSSG